MVSLEFTAKKLAKQKLVLSRIRRSSEKEFKKAKATSRRYSSSLTSLQKRVNSSRDEVEYLGQSLNQKISRLESVQRLKNLAIEKLGLETQNKNELEGEAEFANTEEEKQTIESRLIIIHNIIDEIKNEIKQRTLMEKKIQQAIDEYNKSKSKTSLKIKKNLESKPALMKLVKTINSEVERTERNFNSSKLQEDSTNKRLGKIKSKLLEILKNKPKAKAKSRKAKPKAKAKAKARKKIKR